MNIIIYFSLSLVLLGKGQRSLDLAIASNWDQIIKLAIIDFSRCWVATLFSDLATLYFWFYAALYHYFNTCKEMKVSPERFGIYSWHQKAQIMLVMAPSMSGKYDCFRHYGFKFEFCTVCIILTILHKIENVAISWVLGESHDYSREGKMYFIRSQSVQG